MEVLVYTFRKKDSGVVVCLDANKDNIKEIIKAIELSWLHGKYNLKNDNIIVQLFNGDYYGFNPSSFNSFLCTKVDKTDIETLAQEMYDGTTNMKGYSIVGIDLVG